MVDGCAHNAEVPGSSPGFAKITNPSASPTRMGARLGAVAA